MNKVQRRFLDATTAHVRMDGEETKKIVGYASVFYNGQDGTQYDIYGDGYLMERVMPGAFDRAIREDDVRALFNHDVNQLLGRSTSGTLTLSVDATGLRYEIDPPDTQLARELSTLLSRGDINGSSFSFQVTDSNPVRKEGGCRIMEITGVRLFDVGPVTFPAYTAASSGVRAASEPDLEMRKSIERSESSRRDRERRLRLLQIAH